ncbi:DUF2383 domain-containing protein [Alkaliphilus transvaalensis]|uniref:DUF2383 domain-containing protein n=1 Tax=Alkaliphilus transvaalensis TaxID=114628 RepID=UPI00047DA4DE|nr:DUF2383 domain-containing protein [Alkaliphilus transvaalensis]
MNEPNIETLNQLLQGEHMAIKGYETVMSTLANNHLKTQLNGILEDHKRHAMEINDRIYKLGGDPKESTGVAGLMSDMKLKIEGIVRNDKIMLKELYKGEEMGVSSVKEIIKGDLDRGSLEMVEEILKTDERHLMTLDQLIKEQENK